MEYLAIDKSGYDSIHRKLDEAQGIVDNIFPDNMGMESQWIEGSKLCQLLDISPKTLHNYRQNETLGYSMIGRKIYYRLDEVQALINKHTQQ